MSSRKMGSHTYVIACLGLEDTDSGDYRLTRNVLSSIKPLTKPIPLLIGHGSNTQSENEERGVGEVFCVSYLKSCKGLFAVGKLYSAFISYIKDKIVPYFPKGEKCAYLDVLKRMYMGCSLSSKYIKKEDLVTRKGRDMARTSDFLCHVALTRQPRREFAFVHYTGQLVSGESYDKSIVDFLRAFGVNQKDLHDFFVTCKKNDTCDSLLNVHNIEKLFPVILTDLLKPLSHIGKLRRKMNEKGLCTKFLLASVDNSNEEERENANTDIKGEQMTVNESTISSRDKRPILHDGNEPVPVQKECELGGHKCCGASKSIVSMQDTSHTFFKKDRKVDDASMTSSFNVDMMNNSFKSGVEAALQAMRMMKDQEKSNLPNMVPEKNPNDGAYQYLVPITQEPVQAFPKFPNEFYHPGSNSIYIRKRPSSDRDHSILGYPEMKRRKIAFEDYSSMDFAKSENDSDREDNRHKLVNYNAGRHDNVESQNQFVTLASDIRNYLHTISQQTQKKNESTENSEKNNHANLVSEIVSQLTPILRTEKHSISESPMESSSEDIEKGPPRKELQASCNKIQTKQLKDLALKERILEKYENIIV